MTQYLFKRGYVRLLILVTLVALIGVAMWLLLRSPSCAQYRRVIEWLYGYALPVEQIALPTDAETCLSTRDTQNLFPMFLPQDDGVELLLALETARPDVLVAGQGMAWDSVLGHPWFQERYSAIPQDVTGQDMDGAQVYIYHPAMADVGEMHVVEGSDASQLYPGLWGYRFGSPHLAPEDPFSIAFYWQTGSDALAHDIPVPGYQLRVQLVTQGGQQIWWQVSQPLALEIQPVAGQLRLTSPLIVLPENVQVPAEDAYLVAHLLHPDSRELPLFAGDSLAELPYLPDAQFTPFPGVGEMNWQLSVGDEAPSVALVGGDIPTYTFAGEQAQIVLIWQALATLDQDFKVFVHVIGDENGNEVMIVQDDTLPAAWRAPTSSWMEGMYVRDVHWLTLPAEVSRGEYQIYVGLYHAGTGDRLWVSSPDGESPQVDRIHLDSLWVR